MGDFFAVVFVILAVMGFAAFRKEFTGRPMSWWWLLLGVTAAAAGTRVVSYFALSGQIHAASWTPSAELGHVSIAWYLNTLSRFSAVTLSAVAMVNVVAGVATVAGVFLLSSMLFPGLLPALMAGLFAVAWPAHLALSGSVTVMVPFVMFLVWTSLCQLVYVRQGDIRVHLLAAMFFLFAVFARPEGVVLAAPLLLVSWLKLPWRDWLKPAFFVPVAAEAAVVAIRLATIGGGPQYTDSFLGSEVEWGAFISNLGAWLFDWSRVPLAAMLLWAVGMAARPWRRLRTETALMALWFLLGVAVYYHVSMVDTYQGGRVSLIFMAPLAFLTAAAGELLGRWNHRGKWWAVAVLAAWLALSPLIHLKSMGEDYRAVYETNFLTEA